ncbi:ubiquitin [Capsaspora owczarzaki ATCC 30864]|uniref:Ubiquitin n=1 Tax=Capsaspora owczarzaki (strain ATCC 30864) TaxID=595528 RepID=A0A0D2WHV3_CAPO3|nr:ubiquitin [Capsaspora owczarzaki ATCC 30864]KJE88408.1 ubiquitin [Capsaspora owczarzaki ATCC 30864]|eukprot:XP_004364938.1 ubiquitin [Capsaspora owczarzaki ATCC 30864]
MSDVKPDIKPETSEHVNLKVSSSDGSEVNFKIKKTTKMSKLIDAYCQRVGINPASVRFLFDGARINGDQTAADVGLEDGDNIDVMQEQTGGLCW